MYTTYIKRYYLSRSSFATQRFIVLILRLRITPYENELIYLLRLHFLNGPRSHENISERI